MKKKRPTLFLLVILIVGLSSCNPKKIGPPTADNLKYEKLKLVKVVKPSSSVLDVFGDTLDLNRYYLFTANWSLVPVDGKKSSIGDYSSIDEYLSSLKSMGNLQGDTITTTLAIGGPNVTLYFFDIKNIEIEKITIF